MVELIGLRHLVYTPESSIRVRVGPRLPESRAFQHSICPPCSVAADACCEMHGAGSRLDEALERAIYVSRSICRDIVRRVVDVFAIAKEAVDMRHNHREIRDYQRHGSLHEKWVRKRIEPWSKAAYFDVGGQSL